MKVLYFDCEMGAAGDMLMAALYQLLDEKRQKEFLETMNGLGLDGVTVEAQPSKKCGIGGIHMAVSVHGMEEEEATVHEDHHHEGHRHMSLEEIKDLICGLPVPVEVQEDAVAVYELLAEAESFVHEEPVTEIHFHEVGQLDAIVDIVGVCLLMSWLNPDEVVSSPICLGNGLVRCAHGIVPVPAPAVARLLRGIPVYTNMVEVELCTPTGAALLRYFCDRYGEMPVMTYKAVGYGMGKKDLPVANCVRAFNGEYFASGQDAIVSLSCNIDDMAGEAIGFATEQLLAAGAKDVYTTNIQMKKNRPGILLTVLCHVEDEPQMVRKIFQYTTTIGIRKQLMERYVLNREERDLETAEGLIRRKEVEGYGVARYKLEYEDLARVARKHGISIEEARIRLQ